MENDRDDALLDISRAEAYRQFGIPDVCINPILIYSRSGKIMILILGVSNREGMPQELTKGYIFGTVTEGVSKCRGVCLLNSENAPQPGESLSDRLAQYIAADIGSTFYRPVIFSEDMAMWQLILSSDNVVRDSIKIAISELLSHGITDSSITKEQANKFYENIMSKKE